MNATATHRAVSGWRIVAWLLTGLFILAHGCHVNRDTELRLRQSHDSSWAPAREFCN